MDTLSFLTFLKSGLFVVGTGFFSVLRSGLVSGLVSSFGLTFVAGAFSKAANFIFYRIF